MKEPEINDNSLWPEIFKFLGKCIGSLRRPYKILLFLFVIGLIFVISLRNDTDSTLTIVLFVIVIIFFAIFGLIWEYFDYKLRYAERTIKYSELTNESLKKRLREVVMELLEKKSRPK